MEPEHYMFVDREHPKHPGVVLCCSYEHDWTLHLDVKLPGEPSPCLCEGREAERSALLAKSLAELTPHAALS